MAQSRPAGMPQTSLSTPRITCNPWIILIVVAMGFFMILLDTTIVNVAIPSMIDTLHASLDQILWVLNAYVLTYAILLITAGRLGDMFGPKRMFLSGMVLFIASSAACGLAQDANQLIFFRVVQAVGGALLTPQSLSIITSIFPPEKRGAAFGIWGAVAGLAAVTGPTLGGFLTTSFSWRSIFYVNLPIGVVALTAAFLVMPELTVHRRHHLDVPGVLLATAGFFCLVFGLIEGERYSWGRISNVGAFDIGSIHAGLLSIPTLLAAGVILLVLFIVQEAREQEDKDREPLLPLSLFRDRNFSVANMVSAIISFGMFGLFLPMTIFLQSVLGMSAEQAGVVMVPSSLTSMVVAPFAGRLTDRLSGKWVLSAGLTLFAIGFGLVIWSASLTSTGTSFTLPLIVAGLGMGCTFAPMTALAMRNIAPAQAGAASGFLNTIRQVGGAFGSTIAGAVLQNRLGNELHIQALRYASQVPPSFRPKFVSSFSHAASGGLQVGRGQTGSSQLPANLPASVKEHLQALGQTVFHHAFLNAMKPTLGTQIGVLLLGALVTVVAMRSTPASTEQAAPGAARGGVAAAGE